MASYLDFRRIHFLLLKSSIRHFCKKCLSLKRHQNYENKHAKSQNISQVAGLQESLQGKKILKIVSSRYALIARQYDQPVNNLASKYLQVINKHKLCFAGSWKIQLDRFMLDQARGVWKIAQTSNQNRNGPCFWKRWQFCNIDG